MPLLPPLSLSLSCSNCPTDRQRQHLFRRSVHHRNDAQNVLARPGRLFCVAVQPIRLFRRARFDLGNRAHQTEIHGAVRCIRFALCSFTANFQSDQVSRPDVLFFCAQTLVAFAQNFFGEEARRTCGILIETLNEPRSVFGAEVLNKKVFSV